MIRHGTAVIVFCSTLLLQLLIIGNVGAGDSEAYYYSWSRDLEASYYDHPAGIAYLIRISTEIFGHNTFALRFFSTILINLSLLILYLISFINTRDLKISLFSMLFLLSTPAFLIGGVSASPEPPLIFFSTLSLLFFFLYNQNKKNLYIYISFLLLGIGFNFKYSALFLVIGYLFLLIKRTSIERTVLIRLLLIVTVSLLPVIIWNILHKGVSFEYHLIHRINLTSIPINIFKFIGGQLLYFNPLTVILLVLIILKKIKEGKYNVFLALFKLLLVISIIPMLLIKDSEPHWASLIYIPAAIMCADEFSTKYKRIFSLAIVLNFVLFTLFLIHIFTPIFTENLLKNKDPKYDITNELFGWESVAENIDYIAKQEKIPPTEILLISNHYTMSGQLLFATKSKYNVVCRGRRCNQFTISDIKNEEGFKLFVFVTDNRFFEIPKSYREGAIQQKLKIYKGNTIIREFYIYVKKKI